MDSIFRRKYFIVKKENFADKNNIEDSGRMDKQNRLVILLVLIITAIVFSGSLKLGWTNWDDNLYIYENPNVREATLAKIFLPPANPAENNTYNPLVISSFALEWKLVHDRPFLYHLNNVLLHLCCTALVWLFFRGMGLSVWWSSFAALLFGIHPMRVESVAWITERKDLLSALFYLAALLFYLRYIASGKNKQLFLTFIFFTLSLFSKIQAVTFPFALVLLDWYFQRKINKKVILEKAAFFAGSLVFGLLVGITFLFKKAEVITWSKILSFVEQIALSGYAYVVYILKAGVPWVTSALYPAPARLQPEHWIGVALAIVIVAGAVAVYRKYRFITFGILFFTFNVLFLPMAAAVGDTTFLNDRYTYIAYLGLFFSMAMALQQISKQFPSYRITAAGLAMTLLLASSVLTIRYIPAWKNSETLWSDVIEKYPRQIAMAYVNRGHYFYQTNQSEKALEDFNTAIEMNPFNPGTYLGRIAVYLSRHDNQKALQDYDRYIALLSSLENRGQVTDQLLSDALGNKGALYSGMRKYEKALPDLDLAIKLNPQNLTNYLNRASAYMQLQEYDKAINDFNTCHQYDPDNADILNDRGVCYLRLGDAKTALADFNEAIAISGSNPAYYINRAFAYQKLGRVAEARKDILAAEKMGAVIDPGLRRILLIKK